MNHANLNSDHSKTIKFTSNNKMSKTNFKCMYLVDDRFYKKAISTNTTQNQSVNPSTVLSKNIVYIPKQINDEIETMNVPVKSPEIFHQQRISQAETLGGDQTSTPNTTLKSSEQFDQIIPEASSSKSRKEDHTSILDPTYYQMTSETSTSSDKPMEVNEPQCDCQDNKLDTCNPNSKENDKDHEKRMPEYDKLKKKTQDLKEDPELLELRERFRKIKEDIDYPPSKTDSLTQNDKIAVKKTIKLKNMKMPLPSRGKKFIAQISKTNENRKVTYVCTICRSKFKRMNTLQRHMQNIHGEFFETNRRTEKRKNMNESPQERKKFISDGRRKRNMGDDGKSHKRTRTEFKCPLCTEYFKTESALNRHSVNVHDLNSHHPKGKKRKEFGGKNVPQQYLKRQKNEVKMPIEYVNYF